MQKVIACLTIFILVLAVSGCRFIQTIEKSLTSQHTDSKSANKESAGLKQPDKKTAEQEKEIIKIDPIEEMIKRMTLSEKIGQILMVDVQQDKEGNNITGINEEVKEKIVRYKVGGVILFKGNIKTKEQTKDFIKDMQELSDIPLFIGVDEEGGIVSRIGRNKEIVQVPFMPAFSIGQKGDSQIAYNEAKRMGKILKELGFNINFAPVADIYNNEANTVIGTRSFGKTKEEVSPMVISYAKGLLSENVQPVIKHFPGHGNTEEDSHDGLAYVNKTKAALEKEELVPFLEAIHQDIDVLMRGHLVVKDVDAEYPATLSKKWFEYMKTLMDTKKVLMITDAMNMGAVAKNYNAEEAAVMSFLAGNDIILMPKDLQGAADAMRDAYQKGLITDERLDESVRKILSKKVERNLLVVE